jgi:hypothetical protein
MRRWPTGRARNGDEMGGLEHKAVAAGFQPDGHRDGRAQRPAPTAVDGQQAVAAGFQPAEEQVDGTTSPFCTHKYRFCTCGGFIGGCARAGMRR